MVLAIAKTVRINKKIQMMSFNTELLEGSLIVNLSGDLLSITNENKLLFSEIDKHIEEGILKCALEISKIERIGSVGLGVFITILTKFRNKGGEVVLINPSQQIKELLVMTKLNAIFTIVSNQKEAFEELNASVIF